MYIRMHTCMYKCVNMYIYVHTYTHTYVCMHIHACTHAYIHSIIYIYIKSLIGTGRVCHCGLGHVGEGALKELLQVYSEQRFTSC